MPKRIRLGSLEFDSLQGAQYWEDLNERIEDGLGSLTFTPNLQFHSEARKNKVVAELLGTSEYSLCDSQFLFLLSRVAGNPIPERITGASSTSLVFDLAVKKGLGVSVIGASAQSHEQLRASYPQLARNGQLDFYDGVISNPPTLLEIKEVLGFLAGSSHALVVVALGFPKQEWLALELRLAKPNSHFFCFGAGIDFLAGRITRSPVILQKIGLEWAWRLAQEPGRLWRRYLLVGLPEALRLVVWAFYERVRRGSE
jgi:N-acetylglucosaminyldiphosphoundecaprenol N-acetyl-beta-D-mannosaminyltransferase